MYFKIVCRFNEISKEIVILMIGYVKILLEEVVKSILV